MSEISSIRKAVNALWECERKLRHLAPHYKGNSAYELHHAADQAKASRESLESEHLEEIKEVRRIERLRCADWCRNYAEDLWKRYKGLPPHDAKNNKERGTDYMQGKSFGADDCAAALDDMGDE